MRVKNIIIYLSIILTMGFSGCILDSLKEVPLDIPIEFPFSSTGSNDSVGDEGSFCLTDNDVYMDYNNKIQDIKLLAITFRPTAVSPASLKGNVRLEIRKLNENGELLFGYTITNMTPSAFVKPNIPYEIPLGAEDLYILNAYLKDKGTCLYVAVFVENITPSGTKSISGKVDFMFRTKTDLG